MNQNSFNVLYAVTAVFACLYFVGVFPVVGR